MIEHLHDFGVGEVALYPLFGDELLELLRERVAPEQQHRIARSVLVRARKAAEGEELPPRSSSIRLAR